MSEGHKKTCPGPRRGPATKEVETARAGGGGKAIRRAGADMILTYFAKKAARWLAAPV